MKDLHNKSQGAGTPNIGLSAVEKNHLVKRCENWPTSSGKSQYLRFLHGEKLTHMEAGLARCAECCGGYVDGRYDCGVVTCPLHPLMPYKGKVSPDFTEEV